MPLIKKKWAVIFFLEESFKMEKRKYSKDWIENFIRNACESGSFGCPCDPRGRNVLGNLLANGLNEDGTFKPIELTYCGDDAPRRRLRRYHMEVEGDRILLPAREKDVTIDKLIRLSDYLDGKCLLAMLMKDKEKDEIYMDMIRLTCRFIDYFINNLGYDPNYYINAYAEQ